MNTNEFALFAVCAHTFQLSLSLIINGLKNKPPSSTDFLRTFSHTFSKVRRNPFSAPFSLKINAAFLITQHGGSGACGGMAETFPLLPPFRHMSFLYFA